MATPDEKKLDVDKLPWLGRKLLWLDHAKSADRLIYGLIGACAVLFLADFFYKKKTYIDLEDVPGFYAIYAVGICLVIVLCARAMRAILMRDEAYYAPKDVEIEVYPEHDMERKNFDD